MKRVLNPKPAYIYITSFVGLVLVLAPMYDDDLPEWLAFVGLGVWGVMSFLATWQIVTNDREARKRMLCLKCDGCGQVFTTGPQGMQKAREHFKEDAHDSMRWIRYNYDTKEEVA